jgi:hypothetical protein
MDRLTEPQSVRLLIAGPEILDHRYRSPQDRIPQHVPGRIAAEYLACPA